MATLVAIPTLGIATGALIAHFAAPAAQADTSYCDTLIAGGRWPVALLDSPCSGKVVGGLVVRLSVYALSLAVAPVVVFPLAAQICGTNQDRIARIFPPLMPPVVLAVFLNVFAPFVIFAPNPA